MRLDARLQLTRFARRQEVPSGERTATALPLGQAILAAHNWSTMGRRSTVTEFSRGSPLGLRSHRLRLIVLERTIRHISQPAGTYNRRALMRAAQLHGHEDVVRLRGT